MNKKYLVVIGDGKAVHIGTQFNNHWYTPCGADQATNRTKAKIFKYGDYLKENITCKRCIHYSKGYNELGFDNGYPQGYQAILQITGQGDKPAGVWPDKDTALAAAALEASKQRGVYAYKIKNLATGNIVAVG